MAKPGLLAVLSAHIDEATGLPVQPNPVSDHLAHDALAGLTGGAGEGIRAAAARLEIYGTSSEDGLAQYEKIQVWDKGGTLLYESPDLPSADIMPPAHEAP